MEDIHQLSAGWNEARRQLSERESQWKENMDFEHGCSLQSHVHSLSTAQKDVSALKSEFSILQAAVKRLVHLLTP